MSGDSSGLVIVWSMMSQTPSIHGSFQSHSSSLINLHVMDANHFITIGMDSGPNTEDTPVDDTGTKPEQVISKEVEAVVPSPAPPDPLSLDMSQLSLVQQQQSDEGGSLTSSVSSSDDSERSSVKLWEYGRPQKLLKCVDGVGAVTSSSFHCHSPPGNCFLGVGLKSGVIKIYNVPSFNISSELHFPEMKGKDCTHIRLNLSREVPLITHAYYRNPFRDLILTSVWSDGRIMVCQVAKQ